MTPPRFKQCVCEHLGSQHRDDGTCARCECVKFTPPVRVYSRAAGVTIAEDFRHTPRTMGARPQ
jgi:hypothetical protein